MTEPRSKLGSLWAKRPRFASLRRPITLAFVVALIVHLPFTPAFPLFRMLKRLNAVRDDKKDWDYEKQPDMSLPIELMEMPKVEPPPADTSDNSFAPPPPLPPGGPNDVTLADPAALKAAAAKAEKAKSEAKAAADAKKSPNAKFAAGSSPDDDTKDDDKDGDPTAPKKKKNKKKDKPEDKVVEKPKEPDDAVKKDKEQVGLNGTKDDRVIGKPNVTLALWLEPIRTHALGTVVGEMFACNPEWKPFLAQGLKPLDDLAGVMVVGPQLSESSKATVAVQHKMTDVQVHDAMDAMVQRGGGRAAWLSGDAAKLVLQRKERVMFTHTRDMIFVAPPDSWKSIHDVKDPLSLPPANGRALSLTLQKPSRPLRKLGVTLPDRLLEMRLDVFANADGSADVHIDFDDGTADKAKEDSPKVEQTLSTFFADLSQITQTVDSLSLVPGDTGEKLKLPDVDFDPVEKSVRSTIHFGPGQAGRILGILGKVVCPKKKPGAAAPAPAASK